MKVETIAVFAPGAANRAWPGQIVRDEALGLLAIAGPSGTLEAHRAASRIALDAFHAHIIRNKDILRRFKSTPTSGLRDRMLDIVNEAFRRTAHETFAFARRHEGVTLAFDILLIAGKEAFIGHVGDGRVYLVRRGILHRLTVDHTDTSTTPTTRRRSLGPRPSVAIETLCMELSSGDRFVLCTHGLTDRMEEDDLLKAIDNGPLPNLVNRLSISLPQVPIVAAAAGIGELDTSDGGSKRLSILEPMPLFTHCSATELRQVARATHPRRFSTGAVLFHQGDAGSEFFLVIDGRIRIERDGLHIVTLGPGSNFGEMAMLDDPTRSATAIATRPTELLVVKKEAFFALLRGNPALAVKILWNMLLTLSSNLRRSTAQLADATGDGGVPRPPTADQPLDTTQLDPLEMEDTISGE